MHEVLVNRLGGLSLPRKSVARLTDLPDMTLDVYRGRKTTKQQQQQPYDLLGRIVNSRCSCLGSPTSGVGVHVRVVVSRMIKFCIKVLYKRQGNVRLAILDVDSSFFFFFFWTWIGPGFF